MTFPIKISDGFPSGRMCLLGRLGCCCCCWEEEEEGEEGRRRKAWTPWGKSRNTSSPTLDAAADFISPAVGGKTEASCASRDAAGTFLEVWASGNDSRGLGEEDWMN